MALTFQIIPDAHAQKDGRRYVRAVYSDAQGEVSEHTFLAAVGADTNAIASARGIGLLATLAKAELLDAINGDRMPAFRFATAQQMVAYIAETYPDLSGENQAKFCWWLNNRLIAGDVTDTQVQNAFGLTAGQWATRKANKVVPLAAAYVAIRDATP